MAADIAPCPIADPRIDSRTGTIVEPAFVGSIVDHDVDVVFHLAAVLSGQSEAEFDLGMRVNVDATRNLLEACRALGRPPRFVFSSTVAVFGAGLPDVVPEDSVLRPQSCYGTGKAIAELLVSEYSRRGFIDGIDAVCPVPLDTRLWISSPGVVTSNLLHAARVPASALDGRVAVNLPGLSVTPAQMLASLERAGGAVARARVRCELDPGVTRVVSTWPGALDDGRARRLGFSGDQDFDDVVRQYVGESARER